MNIQTQQQIICKKIHIKYDNMLENTIYYDECDICYTNQRYTFTLYKRIHNCNIKICMCCLKKIMITSICDIEYIMFLISHNIDINNDLVIKCPICRLDYIFLDFFIMFRKMEIIGKYFLRNNKENNKEYYYYYFDL